MSVIPAATILPAKPYRTPTPTKPLRCSTLRDLHQLHAHAIKTGAHHRHPFVAEALLESAALVLPDSLAYALEIFDRLPSPHTSAYNILIRAFILFRSPHNALLLFIRMLSHSLPPDRHTLSCLLKACSRLRSLRHGAQLHAHAAKSGLASLEFVHNSLIHMYATCGAVTSARTLFDKMPRKGVVTWNAMVAGYFKSGDWAQVVALFLDMVDSGESFDQVTLISVLTACGRLGDLELGERIDGYIEAKGLHFNRNLVTSLIDMYAKCGRVEKARELFDGMTSRDVVAWSAMISGYTQSNRCREALVLFNQMQMANVDPNEVTMVSVLSACAVLGAFETGKWVHSYLRRKSLPVSISLGTALVDFYAKCGCIVSALEVFGKMPQKNVWTWSVLIQGFATNGQGREALKLFDSMLEVNVQPNDITFIGVLSACNHAGLVEEARNFFDSMRRDFSIEPRIEHYGCMVDILGRAGLIDEAYGFIKKMPIKPNAIVWRTLLASCKIHKNVEIGEESLNQLVRLESRHSGDFILLSNIYASIGRWEDAVRVRNEMKEKGIKKTPGCSLIELDGMIHEFFAEDSAHPRSKEIYDKVEQIITEIKLLGYVPNIADARLDAEEDEKEVSVSHHSEKLAIAFGLISSPPGAAIRVSKNLRVCTDCHVATKMISKVYGREIVMRDRNRFHHFKDGFCSCNDYW